MNKFWSLLFGGLLTLPALAQQVPQPQPMSAVDTLAALKLFTPPSLNASLVRRGFYAAGDAPTLQYRYSAAPCPIAAGNGDDGAQVRAVNGNCWLAQFQDDTADARQWGVRSDNGTTDNAPLLIKALAASSGTYCIILPDSKPNYYGVKTTITLPTGFNHCLKSNRQWASLVQPNGMYLQKMITATGTTGLLMENIELNGNGDNNYTGLAGTVDGNLIDLRDQNTTDVTLNNLYVHHAAGHGALVAGSGIYVNGGYYTANGRRPTTTGTGSGGGMVIGTNGHNFIIRGIIANNNATFGIACAGTCYDGIIDSNHAYNNGAGAWPVVADNFTGYSANVHNLVISNNLSWGGGNNGIHFGGNKVSYIGNIVDSPAFYGIAHRSKGAYRTGTVTCDGSADITGVGTEWLYKFPYAMGADNLTIALDSTGAIYNVQRVWSNTSLTVSGTTCPAGGSTTYTMEGYVPTKDVVISGNVISGISNPYGAIWVDMVEGGTVSNNTSVIGDGDALMLMGSKNVNISGNTFANKPSGAGVWLNANRYATAGTVTMTNGSATVVGSGTSFVNDASTWGGTLFMITGEATNYGVANVSSNTNLTLTAPWVGTTGAGKTYILATGVNTNNLISGNVFTDTLNGIFAKASIYNTFSGNHIGCTLASATCNGYTGIVGYPHMAFGDAILGNNFPRMKYWQGIDDRVTSVGFNSKDLTPLGPILPTVCSNAITTQASGSMYNNSGTFGICP